MIPSMPELADKGAYASFQKYSPEDVQALQEYGATLGVEVVMEIDQYVKLMIRNLACFLNKA